MRINAEQPLIVIIGAGPTGLSAAWRLKQLGHEQFVVLEANSYAGGLSSSYRDQQGFSWDLGGHVIYSRFSYFDDLICEFSDEGLHEHDRQAWVHSTHYTVPYPFQNHLQHLPKQISLECQQGLIDREFSDHPEENFEQWIVTNFGEPIARHFMIPYNQKVWAYSLELMDFKWIKERVSRIDQAQTETKSSGRQVIKRWGPNARFRYPVAGGVGTIFRKMANTLQQYIRYNAKVCQVDANQKSLTLSNGETVHYDRLINSGAINQLIDQIDSCPAELRSAAKKLKFNRADIIGLGIARPCPSLKCWMYFPDPDCSFYRVTYLSNYSSGNVPDDEHYSLLCEVASPAGEQKAPDEVVAEVKEGLIRKRILSEEHAGQIVSTFYHAIDQAYPIPTLGRDQALKTIMPWLEERDIYSRGRFGAWKYEIGNIDHSVMQGKELVDVLLGQGTEKVYQL